MLKIIIAKFEEWEVYMAEHPEEQDRAADKLRTFLKDKRFSEFYIELDQKDKKQLFNYYKIPLEEDKCLNNQDWIGKSKCEIYPFESHIVNQFYQMSSCNLLLVLRGSCVLFIVGHIYRIIINQTRKYQQVYFQFKQIISVPSLGNHCMNREIISI